MKSRFLMIGCAMLALSACTPREDAGDVNTGNQQAAMASDWDTMGAPAPGSREEFVQNIGDRVFFDYDSYDLRPEARATLEAQARWLGQYSNLGITIEGHADERGTREYNLALGERRANSVKNYLVALGVDPSRVSTISYGKERPDVLGADDSSWARNRRGVSVIQ